MFARRWEPNWCAVFSLTLLVIITLLVLAYGIQLEGALAHVARFAMLTFMAPTIFAYGRIMGASWNILLINKWQCTGRKNPLTPTNGFIDGCSRSCS